MYVEYDSNNSGGGWWLSDEDWFALEKAGWEVQWVKDSPYFGEPGEDRWLGALARSAIRQNVSSMEEAVGEWEAVTGQSSTDAGCPCCGQPHTFSLYNDDGELLAMGPDTEYMAFW